jgi:heat shock protein HtpX
MNWVKTFFWMTVLTIVLVLIGSFFGRGGLIIGLGVALVTNGIAYFFGDKMAIAAAQAQEVSPQEAPGLHRLADRLAAQYGVPKPRVYISPDPNPNAFATGRSPRHASIVVNEGLLRILDDEEVYGVLAHEFAHVKNRDILISTIVAAMAGAITFLSQFGLFFGGGRDSRDSNPLGLVGALLLLVLGPIAALLVQLAVSRSREYEADHTGAEVSHDPLALARALRKLQRGSEAVPSPIAQPAFSHLYIVNPLSGQTLAGLFSTHPPLEKRIQRLEEMARRPN